jgi:hypothetical protein
MNHNFSFFNILKDNKDLQTIYVFGMTQVSQDPYEKNTKRTFDNPIPVKGLIKDISFSGLVWKLQGLKEVGAKELIVEKKYRTLFETCGKILIDSKEYAVYQDGVSKQFQILERKDYLVILLERK